MKDYHEDSPFEIKTQDNSEMACERHINANFFFNNPARDRLKTDGISGGFCGKDNKIVPGKDL